MAETTFLYLTELVGLKVFDLKGRALGRVKDAALVPLVDPFRVDRILIGAGDAWLSVRYDQVRSVTLDGVELGDEKLTPYHSDEYMLRMVRDLMDQQIIDAHGRKVVRVTDVTFEIVQAPGHASLRVFEVDVGLRSIFRRLAQGVFPRPFIRRLQGPIAPSSIRWEHCNIIEPDPMRRLRLNFSPAQLEKMHPADLADIVEELGPEGREAVLTSIDSESAAEALSEIDPAIQASIIESLEADKAADILEEMSPDEAADVLQELEEETSREILDEMEPDPKIEVRELLEYGEHTAGGMMNTEYLAMPAGATVGDAIAALRAAPELADTAHSIYLVDERERLVAGASIARLFTAATDARLRDVVTNGEHSAPVTAPEVKITEMFDKYNLLSLPVVDGERRLVGVITADDVISVLRGRK